MITNKTCIQSANQNLNLSIETEKNSKKATDIMKTRIHSSIKLKCKIQKNRVFLETNLSPQ